MVTINRTINDYRHVKRINFHLKRSIELADSTTHYWKMLANSYKGIADAESEKFNAEQKISSSLKKNIKKQEQTNKLLKGGVGILSIIVVFCALIKF